VVIPLVGSLTTTLPDTFTRVTSAEANAGGDGRGGTQLNFNMTLFPPIGADRVTFGYKARITDGVVPKASMSVLPVNPLESPSFKGGAASYKGGAESGADLTAGANTIDANLLKIRDGASDLVAGILQLQEGADKLSAGLTNDAAPGAKKLADGAGQLDAGAKKLANGTDDLSAGAKKLKSGAGDLSDGTGKVSAGADKLNKGAGDLSDGLKKASAGGPQLLQGVAQLKAGAQSVDAGLVKLQGAVNAGVGSPAQADTLRNGVAKIQAGIAGPVTSNLNAASGKVTDANGYLGDITDPGRRAELAGILNDIGTAVGTARAILNGPLPPGSNSIRAGLNTLDEGLVSLNTQVGGGIGTPTSTVPDGKGGEGPSLRNGVNQLIAGMTQLQEKGGELVTGLGQLSAGAGQLKAGTGDLSKGAGDLDAGAGKLAAGTGDLEDGTDQLNAGAGTLKDGTGELSAGASKLADGLGTAATGSGQLAAGLGTAAESAPALPEGAQKLSDQGSSQLANVGNATAMDYGVKYALIEAGATRAATAQPYGSPEGATSLTAYKFEIAGEEGADSANLMRGVAAVVLLGAAGLLATIRRRGII
jgi:putative membrane protein